MSHFTVTVRVPADTDSERVQEEVAQLLAPYQENNMDDCPPEFLEFESIEEESREEYESGSVRRVRLADGTEFYPWDRRFRVGDVFNQERVYPEGAEEVEVAFTELFSNFEEYMAEFCGHDKREAAHGEYGYYHNPNSKWDWYSLGGRWSGFYPVKEGANSAELGRPGVFGNEPDTDTADVLRIRDIDRERIESDLAERVGDFWQSFRGYIDGTLDIHDEHDTRSRLLRLGWLQCKDEDELTEDDRALTLRPWKKNAERFDVIDHTRLDDPEAHQREAEACLHPLCTYAYLDHNGWREPGKMGWWGVSHAEPGEYDSYAEAFFDWFNSGDDRDWVAVIDCHV